MFHTYIYIPTHTSDYILVNLIHSYTHLVYGPHVVYIRIVTYGQLNIIYYVDVYYYYDHIIFDYRQAIWKFYFDSSFQHACFFIYFIGT